MRTVELAKVALAAEALYLRRVARRQALRGAFGAAAAIFGLAVLVVLHVLGWTLLARVMTPVKATLILLAVDVVITVIFAVLAMKGLPDPVEQEAGAIKTQAIAELKRSLTVMGMAAELAGVAFRSSRAARGGRAGAAVFAAEMASRLIGR